LAFSAAPASLLASEKRFPKNHDGFTYRQPGARVNSIEFRERSPDGAQRNPGRCHSLLVPRITQRSIRATKIFEYLSHAH